MASCCNPWFLNPGLSHWLLVLTMTCHFSVTEMTAPIQLRGEIGGNVTFRCPVVKLKPITLIYLQKGTIYVNGYYAEKDMDKIPTWKNTRFDRNKTTVHMDSLNISHSGDYDCIVRYHDGSVETVTVHLSLTANYSKPKVTMKCKDGLSCLVNCTSHGGYPGINVTWHVTGSQMWRVGDNITKRDPQTMMFNSFSTAYFNCSKGEWNCSCSVGNVTSNMFSACTTKVPPKPPTNSYVITAFCAIVLTIIIVVVVVLHRKLKNGAQITDLECEANGQSIALNKTNEGKEAS